MKITSNGTTLGSNEITTPYQHSTRDWPHENETYFGHYQPGTVWVEPQFTDMNPMQGYLIQAAIWGK